MWIPICGPNWYPTLCQILEIHFLLIISKRFLKIAYMWLKYYLKLILWLTLGNLHFYICSHFHASE
jgi:hypothetical protein